MSTWYRVGFNRRDRRYRPDPQVLEDLLQVFHQLVTGGPHLLPGWQRAAGPMTAGSGHPHQRPVLPGLRAADLPALTRQASWPAAFGLWLVRHDLAAGHSKAPTRFLKNLDRQLVSRNPEGRTTPVWLLQLFYQYRLAS